MPHNEFCEARQDVCDPTDCPREFCTWRDTVWVLEKLREWAYSDAIDENPEENQ